MNKLLLGGWIVFLIILPIYHGFAQNMGAINALHSQHIQNFSRQFTQDVAMRAAMRKNSTTLTNAKVNYRVILNSGATLVVQSRIMFDENGKAYLELENKSRKKEDTLRTQKILPAMTRSITKLTSGQNEIILGSPADSCWLFKSISGAVNAYSFLPETYDLHIGYLKMIQKENNELLTLNEANLKTILADDPQAMALVDKKKYFEALQLYNKNSRKKLP